MRQYSGTERTTMQNERAREHAVERAVESKGKNYSHLLKF
jgi:hypothetical protein